MGLLDYTLQHQGSPWGLHEPGLLHRPPPPSSNSFQRPLARGKSTPSHPAPGESIKPVLLPADPPRESRSAAGAGAARLPGRCRPRPRGICHQAKALRRGSEALAESGFVWPQPAGKGFDKGPRWKAKKIQPGRRIPEQQKGEKRRRVCCYLRWLRLYRNSFHKERRVSGGSSGRHPRRSAVRYFYKCLPLLPVSRIWAAVMQRFLESRTLHLRQFPDVLL